jgi:hypothetical protein
MVMMMTIKLKLSTTGPSKINGDQALSKPIPNAQNRRLCLDGNEQQKGGIAQGTTENRGIQNQTQHTL